MQFTIRTVVNALPKKVYQAWLSGPKHSAMTGGKATGSARKGGSFTAWDGYIWGKNLALTPYSLIRQSWRTTQFKEDQPDSEILLRLVASGKSKTRITLTHSKLYTEDIHYKKGWSTHYFTPMKEYFNEQ